MAAKYQMDRRFISYLDERGTDSRALFKKAGIAIDFAKNESLSLDRQQYLRLMNVMSESIDETSVLDYADVDESKMFLPPLFAALCSENARDGFYRVSKYKAILGPFKIVIDEDEEFLTMRFSFDDDDAHVPKFSVLAEQVIMTSLIRRGTDQTIVPSEVVSVYPYQSELLSMFFGTEPRQGDYNGIRFKKTDVLIPFVTESKTMLAMLEPGLVAKLEDMNRENSIAAALRSELIDLIPAGRIALEDAAKSLAVSVRTLQRKLSEEGTSFMAELNKTRELLAKNYIKHKEISNDDIAYLVGYSDATAFARAFLNWTGKTMREYRRELSN